MIKYISVIILFFPLILLSQPVPVTFYYTPQISSFNTVRIAGSFNNWSTTDPNYLMSKDSFDNQYSITLNLQPGLYQYKFMVDGNWYWDPNNPVIVDPVYQNSQIVVSNPMVTYLLPIDTNSYTPTTLPHIKAIFAFSNPGDSIKPLITLKINGRIISSLTGYYDSTKKILDYPLSSNNIHLGTDTILAGIILPNSFNSKTIKLNVVPDPKFNLLTENIIYKKSNIVIYGKIWSKPISSVDVNLNGIDYSTIPDSNNNFACPVNLKEDTNYISVTVNSPLGTATKTQTLIYDPDDQPVIQLSHTVSGRNVSITALASSPANLPLTYSWFQGQYNPVQVSLGNTAAQNIQVSIPDINGEYIFKVKAADNRGKYEIAGIIVNSNADSVHVEGLSEHPGWVDSLILYEVYSPTYGQNQTGLKGVIEKIDYLKDLGINAIWLTPIFDGNYNGYAVRNYYLVNPALGTEDDLRELIQAAHQRGIRILLDLVINHTWTQHAFFQNILALKSMSPFANYYLWDGTPGLSSFNYYYNWSDLPNLNVNNPELENYLYNAAEYWIRNFDIDGYRCDVAWGIEMRNPSFWQEMRRRLKSLKPEIFLLAESPADNNYNGTKLNISNNKFDAAYDWELRGFGSGALNDLLTGKVNNVSYLNSVITKSYPVNDYPFRFVENHDFLRATTEFGIKQSLLAHTIVFTVNGIPLIYGGGEVGELSQLDKINWSDPNNFEPYFKKLISIRKRYIRNNAHEIILSNSSSGLVDSYITQSDSNNVFTIANFGSSTVSFTVNFGGNIKDSSIFLNDLINDTSDQVLTSQLNSITFNLSGYQAKVFGLQKYELTSVEGSNNQVYSFNLSQNYPNPFNPNTVISYQLAAGNRVTLKVYDILGRLVKTLVDEYKPRGEYSVNFDASNLSSGVYFYQLKAGTFTATKKLLLIK